MTQIPTWSGGPANPTNGRAAPGITIGGRYSLRAAVGHGGMGTVWRAADTLLRRDVAVKEVVLPPGLAPSDRDAMYERTLREARAAAALQHPAVVQVYDVVTEGGRPWIVMELLDARSLADMVIEDGPLAPRAVAKIGIALLGALEVAHAIGVLHRDVKPANVLICSDGRCVLTDFGVARMPTDVQLTTPGMVLGSPHFISPERAMGQDFGPPSDLFSLGVTLYTAVEGRPPFDKGDPIETMHAVVEDPPAPPVRSGALTRVLLGLLEKDPARRLDVTASRTMLRELLAGPLASNAAGHLVTDPYAVVPSQRSPWQQPADASQSPTAAGAQPGRSTRPPANGEIGGSAMLAPGESLTERIARSSRDAASSNRAPAAGANPLETPTGAMPGAAGRRGGPLNTPTGAMPGTGGRGTVHTARGGGVGRGLDGARQAGDSVLRTVKGWPRRTQLAVAGGVAAVLLIGIVAFSLGGGEDPADTPPPQAAPTSEAPVKAAFATQPHSAKGVSVNVPKNWKKSGAGVYTDYTDPEDSGRRVRILVEDGRTPMGFMRVAEGGLKKNGSSCKKPYAQVALQETEIGGKPAAELEYTCGEGSGKRHGVWRAITEDGKAYSFYLTTPDDRFEESKPIFDEMVRSFRLTSAG
ncbi:protein kinase [Micromonospora sp. WMMD1102]|uniref:serine/threonine-protein kinase n=1 Tax=Micromonospora sp. WMMD1102 TaxID=3016105 RepID=UPI0024152195|nr:serine/threonine-protein kinase [Micromonospora sp. WMMD1102]MDG4784488.1 protein kinase [Micromonospora sp. WMMD1102]